MIGIRSKAFAIAAVMLVPSICKKADADGFTLSGSTFPMRNCRIQSILGGQLVYTDPSGQRQQRSLDEVATLSFEGLAALDEAEKLIADRDLAAGARRLMQAVLAVQNDLQRQWVHGRLARIHDARGEYVQAAGHAAVVMVLADDAYWSRLEPVSQPNEASYPAARESLDNLQSAARSVKNATLKTSIGRMRKIVEPITQRLAAAYDGPVIAPGSTVSGISRTALLGTQTEAKPAQPESPATAAATPDRKPAHPPLATPPAPAPPVAPTEPTSAAAIDTLLRERKFVEAAAICERVAVNPGERDLAQFLFQYGTALAGAERPADAAVMFVRCAAQFPSSPQAAAGLVKAAMICRDSMKNTEGARRLLERAMVLAQAADQPQTVSEAQQALQSLTSGQ